jgi:hypothetical protein
VCHADFGQHLQRERIDARRGLRAGACGLPCRAEAGVDQRFSHLAARGIAGAQDQHAHHRTGLRAVMRALDDPFRVRLIDHLDIDETGLAHQLRIVLHGNCAGDAFRPARAVGTHLRAELAVRDDIAHADASAGPQHAQRLAEDRRLVW